MKNKKGHRFNLDLNYCFLVSFLLVSMFSSSCGYRIAGKATAIPRSINSIAVPIFINQTTKYRLEQRLTGAVVEELISRTNYQITSDAGSSDALLSGNVTEFT